MNDPRFNSTKTQDFQLFERNQLDMSRTLYEQISQIDPRDFDSRFMLGVIASRSGNNNESIRFLNEAIKIRVKAPGALCQLAIAYHDSGDNLSAIRSLQEAISYKSDYYDAYIKLLRILSLEGMHGEMIECCDAAIIVLPDREDFSRHRVMVLELLSKNDDQE